MYAIQRLNERPDVPVWGVVTNGDVWELGQLTDMQVTQFTRKYTLDRLKELFVVLNWLLSRCADAVKEMEQG